MSGIKWQRAKAVLSKTWTSLGYFLDVWPERMAPRQLAVLQCPPDAKPGDAPAWRKAIEAAVAAGSIPHVIQQFELPSYVLYLDGRTPPPPKKKDMPAIAADDFMKWLGSQNETPSAHIQAWIDASTQTSPQAVPVVQVPTSETPVQRRARWLALFEKEEIRGKRGALQRVADSEGVDRANMKKDIDKARAARDEQTRAGTWTSQLVQDGKRKG